MGMPDDSASAVRAGEPCGVCLWMRVALAGLVTMCLASLAGLGLVHGGAVPVWLIAALLASAGVTVWVVTDHARHRKERAKHGVMG